MFMNFSLSFERQTPFRVRLSLIFFSYFPALAVSRFAKLVLVQTATSNSPTPLQTQMNLLPSRGNMFKACDFHVRCLYTRRKCCLTVKTLYLCPRSCHIAHHHSADVLLFLVRISCIVSYFIVPEISFVLFSKFRKVILYIGSPVCVSNRTFHIVKYSWISVKFRIGILH